MKSSPQELLNWRPVVDLDIARLESSTPSSMHLCVTQTPARTHRPPRPERPSLIAVLEEYGDVASGIDEPKAFRLFMAGQ
jgi:hypothetical protein